MRRLLLVVLGAVAARVAAQQDQCYPTIGTINSAMRTERIRIQNGGVPDDMYEFVLCPNTFFDAGVEFLEPVLNNAVFRCGSSGDPSNRCEIAGGKEQVVVLDSLVSGYYLQQVSFVGLTFSNFKSDENRGTSIAAYASITTTATFTNCIWQDFTSDFVILQSAEKGSLGPMTVEIQGGKVLTGSTSVIFDNDGGLLRVKNLDISSVTAAAIIATANNGASFLENTSIVSSNVNSVTYTTSGATQSVLYSTVSRMNYLDDAFYVEGLGSSLLLNGLTLDQNKVQASPWSAVSVRTGAIARIAESSISDNALVEFGVVVFDSKVWISDSFINRNSGSEGQTSISAPVFAITDAEVNIDRVEFNDNAEFSGVVMAMIRSQINIHRSCFQRGQTEFVVFVSNDGKFDVSDNYVSGLLSRRCETTGPRLFVESTGSGCFVGSSQCEGSCLELAGEDECLAQRTPTVAPVAEVTAEPISLRITWPPVPASLPSASALPTPGSIPTIQPNSPTPTTQPAFSMQPLASPLAPRTLSPQKITPSNGTDAPAMVPSPFSIRPTPAPIPWEPTFEPKPLGPRSKLPTSSKTSAPSIGGPSMPSTQVPSQPLSQLPTTSPSTSIPTLSTQPSEDGLAHDHGMGSNSHKSSHAKPMAMNMTMKKKKNKKKIKEHQEQNLTQSMVPSANPPGTPLPTTAGKGKGEKSGVKAEKTSMKGEHKHKMGKAVKRVMRAFNYAQNATDTSERIRRQ